MRHFIAIAAIAIAFNVTNGQTAQADIFDFALAVPRAVVNDGVARVVPIVDLSQTIPSGNDVRAVPRIRNGRVITYPVQVLKYGLNLYPTSRILRQNGFSIID